MVVVSQKPILQGEFRKFIFAEKEGLHIGNSGPRVCSQRKRKRLCYGLGPKLSEGRICLATHPEELSL